MQTSYPRAKIPYLSLLIILALINQPYLESLPVTRASEVIVTSKPMAMGNGQWAKEYHHQKSLWRQRTKRPKS
ncbi:hypothetical protein BSPWISOXPB_4594 [uncultured Gammaproteobacteria bacterium]|nr:hypothetical protein BSPWISOXPB_4594 [uncultured Gammaproteobacteria bacterium]